MNKPRKGFGVRHPDVLRLLDEVTAVASELVSWGPLRLRFDSYLSLRRLPEELVTSVRCVVTSGDRVVVTRSPDDVNIWPGGRREPGETIHETVIREVYEETGCRLVSTSLRPLGFLHAQHLVPPPAGHLFPHPDFFQLIFEGDAANPPESGWQDSDGYVEAAWLETPEDARMLELSPLSIPFLDAVTPSPGR